MCKSVRLSKQKSSNTVNTKIKSYVAKVSDTTMLIHISE